MLGAEEQTEPKAKATRADRCSESQAGFGCHQDATHSIPSKQYFLARVSGRTESLNDISRPDSQDAGKMCVERSDLEVCSVTSSITWGLCGADGRQDETRAATLSEGCRAREREEERTPSCCDAG